MLLVESLVLLAAVLVASSNQIRISCMLSVLLSCVLVQVKLVVVFVMQTYFDAVATESQQLDAVPSAQTKFDAKSHQNIAVSSAQCPFDAKPADAPMLLRRPAQPQHSAHRYQCSFVYLNDNPYHMSQKMTHLNEMDARKYKSSQSIRLQRHKRKETESYHMNDSPRSKKRRKRVCFMEIVEIIDQPSSHNVSETVSC